MLVCLYTEGHLSLGLGPSPLNGVLSPLHLPSPSAALKIPAGSPGYLQDDLQVAVRYSSHIIFLQDTSVPTGGDTGQLVDKSLGVTPSFLSNLVASFLPQQPHGIIPIRTKRIFNRRKVPLTDCFGYSTFLLLSPSTSYVTSFPNINYHADV